MADYEDFEADEPSDLSWLANRKFVLDRLASSRRFQQQITAKVDKINNRLIYACAILSVIIAVAGVLGPALANYWFSLKH